MAFHQDIRPLHHRHRQPRTDQDGDRDQLLRLLGNTPLQLGSLSSGWNRTIRATPPPRTSTPSLLHLEARERKYDGLIIGRADQDTSVQGGRLLAQAVPVIDWVTTMCSPLHVCWGAQAGLKHRYGIRSIPIVGRCSAFSPSRSHPRNRVLPAGFDAVFPAPHSRPHPETGGRYRGDAGLDLLAVSDEAESISRGPRRPRTLCHRASRI